MIFVQCTTKTLELKRALTSKALWATDGRMPDECSCRADHHGWRDEGVVGLTAEGAPDP